MMRRAPRICALFVLVALTLLPQICAAAGADPLWLRGGYQAIGGAGEARLIPGTGLIAVARGDVPVKIYRVSDGMIVREIDDFGNALAPSPDGLHLAVSGREGNSTRMYRIADGALVRSFTWSETLSCEGSAGSIDFSPDGTQLAGGFGAGSQCSGARVWSTADGATLLTQADMSKPGVSLYSAGVVRFSADGNHLLMISSSNDGGGFKAYRFSDGALLSLNVDGGAGGTLAVSPAGGVFATMYNSNQTGVFGLSQLCDVTAASCPAKTPLVTLQPFLLPGSSFFDGRIGQFSPDGTRIVTRGTSYISGGYQAGTETVLVYDAANGTILRSLTGEPFITASETLPVFSADSASLFSIGTYIRQIDLATGSVLNQLAEPFNRASSVAFSPDGSQVAVGSARDYFADYYTVATRCSVDVRSALTGAIQNTIDIGPCSYNVGGTSGSNLSGVTPRFTQGGENVLALYTSTSATRQLGLWNASTGANVWNGVDPGAASPFAVPATGSAFWIGKQLRSLDTGAVVHDLSSAMSGSGEYPAQAVFTADGSRVAVLVPRSQGLGSWLVFDVLTGAQVSSGGPVSDDAINLWLSPSGDTVRVFYFSGAVKTWRVSDGALLSSITLAGTSTLPVSIDYANRSASSVSTDGSRFVAHTTAGPGADVSQASVRAWSASDGSLLETYYQGVRTDMRSIAVDPTAPRFVYLSGKSTIGLIQLPPSTIPAVPTIGTVTPYADGSIQVSWSAVSGATSYNLYMATASGITKTNYASLAGGHVHANVTSPYTHANALAGTTYYLVVTALSTAGESAESAEVYVTVPTGGDALAPSVATGLAATAASSTQINLSWTASTDNVGVTGYKLYRGGTLVATLGNVTSHSDTGLTASTSYSYTVAACDGAGNCSAQSASVSATTLATGLSTFIPSLELSWNLLGNSLNITLDVAAIFGNQDSPVSGITENIASIWKWNAFDGRWAFYSPQLTLTGIANYAVARNYDALTTIGAGEGYWVNAISAMSLPVQSGTAFSWVGSEFLHGSTIFQDLPTGFNLIAHAGNVAPSQFNHSVSPTPPAAGVVPTDNFTSLWAWDATLGNWYFYSPLLESTGGLQAVKDYADSKNYLHFQDFNKTLGAGVGFWVNRSSSQ